MGLQKFRRLYSLGLAQELVKALRSGEGSLRAYVHWFSSTQTFRIAGTLQRRDIPIVGLLLAAMLGQITIGIWLLTNWLAQGSTGGWAFGLALLLAYPIVTAYGFACAVALWRLSGYVVSPKRFGKAVVGRLLERQVSQLRRKHHFEVIAVAGSVGKTSTKLAIAELLGTQVRVNYQKGNYNDRVTVPLVFFAKTQPSLYNVFGWIRLFGENAATIHHPYPYDVVVIELGTDGPGQMKQFAYTRPDLTLLTAIAPEHMENFGSLSAVVREETSIFDYSKFVLVNEDTVPEPYIAQERYATYSLSNTSADNYCHISKSGLHGQDVHIVLPSGVIKAHVPYIGAQGASAALAASAVAAHLGFDRHAIQDGLEQLEPFAGRMNVLNGVKDTRIIDDTYNASPLAVKAALDVLYAARTAQRIAVLGSMNEMGAYAKTAHEEVGAYCNAKKLDYVVTLGRDAERWIAPAAKAEGCQVRSFQSATSCAVFVRKQLHKKAVVLVKGSQNGVFAEEVVKQLLAHPKDVEKLVRQSPSWLRIKARQSRR